tara:strand:+ start:516 stop:1169 length:654 start_codon:yes stop_codon:yes gene_type:complete
MPRKKVKDMPRKQQMAVKAAMAEKAAGKKSPTKMVSAKDNNAAIKENKKKKTKKIVKRVVKTLFTPTGGVAEKLVKKAKKSYKTYKAKKAQQNAVKEGAKGAVTGGAAKRGLKDNLVKQKFIKQTFKKIKKKPNWRDEYENDHIIKQGPNKGQSIFDRRSKDTSPGKVKASALKMKTSPTLKKLSASCKAAAKRKFKVYPSAYANMWASKTQRQGKC